MIISIDTETDLIARGKMAPDPVCVSYQLGDGPPGVVLVDGFRKELELILSGELTILGQNIAYDMAVLGHYWPDLLPAIFEKYRRGQVRDIGLDQKAIDIAVAGGTSAYKYSLEALCQRHDIPSPDKSGPWRLEFAALRGVPVGAWPQGAVDYVLGDAAAPMQIHRKQEDVARRWEQKAGSPLLHLASREAYKAFAAHLIACWGMHADAGRVALLKGRLQAYLEESGQVLRQAGLVRADGTRDTKAAKARMVAIVGEAAPKTDTGEVSLDKEACAASGDEILVRYSDYCQTNTLLSRVEDLEQGVHAPLQSRFDTLLETSRMSTSKPGAPLVGVQAQNFPRALVGSAKTEDGGWMPGARECLEPRPGHVFVSADLPQAELRSISQVCRKLFGYSALGDTLNEGRDPHVWFGGSIVGMDYPTALAAYHAGDAVMKNARQQAKPCNFGFWGGMGAVSFAAFAWATYRVRLSEDEAKRLKGVWMHTIPEARAYFDWVGKSLGDRDSMLVKHVLTGRWRGRVGYCQGCNTQFQEPTATAASQGLQEAQFRAYTQRGSALWDSRTIMYTHDEIVMETPAERAHDAALELSYVMAEAFNEWHPDVPARACSGPDDSKDPRVVAPCVSRIYSKDMHPVWDGGKLVPWVPEGWAE